MEINKLKQEITKYADLLSCEYPRRGTMPKGTKAQVDLAQRILVKQKATEAELQNILSTLKNLYTNKKKEDHDIAKEARKQAEQKEKKLAEAQKNAQKLEPSEISHMARESDPNNPFRPDWAYIDGNGNWTLDANRLAEVIADNFKIRRVEENGKVEDYTRYNPKLGHWEKISCESLGNYIDLMFKDPNCIDDLAANPKYAEDLHTAKAVRDVLTLLKSKIEPINPQNTFVQPPKYVVHCKTFDFDVMKWKKVPFSPDNYFVSGLRQDPDELCINTVGALLKLGSISEDIDQAADAFAPKIQQWLTQSVGDKETEKCFLERLGLSFIHDYRNSFFVFIKSEGGQGKSYFHDFLERNVFSNVSNLDLDTIVKKGSFDASEMEFKDINLTSEVVSDFVPDTAINVIKSLSSGDLKNFSQKFKNTAQFRNWANLWFNTNHFPRFETYDDAVARRADLFLWHSIDNFEQKFTEDDLKKEVPEFIAVAMLYAHRVLVRDPISYDYFNAKIKLSRSKTMIQLYKSWAGDNDFLGNFLAEKCTTGAGLKIGCRYLLQQANKYLREIDPRANLIHPSDLTDKLAKLKVYKSTKPTSWKEYASDRGNTAHKGVYVYEGITLKNFAGAQLEDKEFNAEQHAAGIQRNPLINIQI